MRDLPHLRVLVGREVRSLLRDPITLVLVFLAPALAALIASAGLGSPPKVDAAVVISGSNSHLGDPRTLAALVTAATPKGKSPLRVLYAPDANAARADVVEGKAVAAMIIPSDSAPPKTPVSVIVNRNVPFVGDLTVSAARTVATRLDGVAVGVAPQVATTTTVSAGRRPLDPGEIYGPVIAVFFLFLASGFVARGLVAERELGTFARMRSLPIATRTIVTGKTVTMLSVAAVEFTVVLFTMTLAYGARWGNLGAVALITFCLSLAVAAVAVVIASFSRTQNSAGILVSFVALLFAALGGSLVPLQNLPPVMSTIARFTPNGVGLAAMHNISANGQGIFDVAQPAGLILLFTIIVGGFGLMRLQRTVAA
jgi:ABC-2 type transport system permease protein